MTGQIQEGIGQMAFQNRYESAEGLQILQAMLLELEHQIQVEGTATDASPNHALSPRPAGRQEQFDKETVVRRLIQRFRRES